MTKSWPVTASGSQGVFRGRGSGLGYGRQATFLSWFQLVQLPGQVLRFYSSREFEQMLVNVKIKSVYSVKCKITHKTVSGFSTGLHKYDNGSLVTK
jgi:hypothetical protein